MISYTLQKPLFHSLYKAIRQDIESGLLPAGSRLPSKRQYALDLKLSLSTVEQALDLLEQEGFIETYERKGAFVLPCPLPAASADPFSMRMLPEDPIQPDGEFPASLWFKTMRLVMSRDKVHLSQVSPYAGSARLRNVIARYLHEQRQMNVQPEQVIIASGAQELYAILCRMFGSSYHVAIESPGYGAIAGVYEASSATIERLPLEEDGISLDALNQAHSQFLHVSPFSSFPDSIVVSPAKRKAYLRWIASRKGYLIEDDYNSEFFQNGPMLRTLYAMDPSNSVIYLNTFSKSLSSSLRLGYMVLPEALLPCFEKTSGQLSCTVTMLEQYTLAEFIENGSFERLIARRRRSLAKEKKAGL